MPRRLKAVLFALFAVTGFSALTLQVVWQRVISMHAGVDLFSFATVVSAFLGGLGIGSLAGGALADRLGPRRSLLAFACSNAGIGIFAWLSIRLFYDGYRAMVPHISGTLGAFLFHFALLLVPTVLMGLSLPLVSRGIVDRVQDAGPLVGRLYAINTLGAGLGAAVSGWLLLGNLGFRGSVRVAGTLNLLAAALVLSLWRTASRMPEEVAAADEAGSAAEVEAVGDERAAWPWFVIYGLTGAVALGLEVVFFRTIDSLMRSNSYTFAHVLTLYLLLFGTGAAIASRVVGRVKRPERWFLGLQYGVGLAALAGLFVLVQLPGLLGIDGPLRRHFAIDGYNLGQYKWWPATELARMAFVHVLAPLLVMGLPVLLMGSAFPFAQALVARRIDTLGRQTGRLLFANIAGNVTGTLVVGFFLIDRIGTSGVFRLLAALLLIPGLAAAAMAGERRRKALLAGGAVLVMGGALVAFPSNYKLWSFFHSAQDTDFSLAEDRACVNALRRNGDEYLLFINGASQNGYPYDDYHLLIGILPALMHPDPTDAMAVGLGIGATPYGMLIDDRIETIDVVELCGGELDLLRSLADGGSPENQRLFSDDRMTMHVGDGRKYLLKTDERFDVMTVDVIRPQSAFSGSLYSVEFYELVKSRLERGGVFAQWLPSDRTANGVTEVFPHVLGFTVPTYHFSQFFLASNEPLNYDGAEMQRRLDRLVASANGRFVLPEGRLESIRKVLGEAQPTPLRRGELTGEVGGDQVNRDLFPRDEYFLNNPVVVPRRPAPET